jgi:hypothetical protein
MKRLGYIISTFLIFVGMYGGNVGADSIFKLKLSGEGSVNFDVLAGTQE